MFKRSLFSFALAISFAASILIAQTTGADETAKTRPDKQEIIDIMAQVNKIPPQQQTAKIDSIIKNSTASKTPRSDFMFCLGAAYLGNRQGQICAANAYERATGIVEDFTEAYTWHAIAGSEGAEKMKIKLVSVYPAPTDEELENAVNARKSEAAHYLEQVKEAKK
jgi:hypothetical protein